MDKSFYDIDSADELKELWEADLDPVSYLSCLGRAMLMGGFFSSGFKSCFCRDGFAETMASDFAANS